MNNILSKEVSFPISKLLKEKGYNEKPNYIGNINDYIKGYCFDEEDKDSTLEIIEFQFEDNVRSNYYLMPTISEVIDWIYEKYDIWISINTDDLFSFYFVISRTKTSLNDIVDERIFNIPTDAYEKAIEHTLKELIK